jgi:predicted Zn finger-like uncharacterized protein
MIVTCDGCATKYLLADEKVPEIGIRVRCPKCRFVWRLNPPAPASIFEVSSSEFADESPVAEAPRGGWASMGQPASSFATETAAAPVEKEVVISDEQPAAEAKSAPFESPELRKKRERAKRLARVFVSDILVYNREKRDQGLANGDLMAVLGSEIKKAWEAFKEKVGPELVESSDYFRDALNEILAGGQKVF